MHRARSLQLVFLLFSLAVALQSAVAQTLIGTVNTGVEPDAVAVNGATNKIYVANQTSNTVTVIDGASNDTTIVAAEQAPVDVRVNPLTNKVYVLNACGNDPTCSYKSNGTVTVIDGATNSTTTVNVDTSPYQAAVNTVTNKIYVDSGRNTVNVIDGATNQTTSVAVGDVPQNLAVNPVTNEIYVANLFSGTVTVINGATLATTTVQTGADPVGVAVNSVTNQIYVTNYGDGTVTVIDGTTNNTSTVNVGPNPYCAAVNQVTNQIYVANFGSNTVTVIDGATLNTRSVTVGNAPIALTVDPVTNKIYVANSTDNTMTMIDGATNNTATISVGNNPVAIAVNVVTNKIYVANEDNNTVSVIAGANAAALQFVPVPPCRLVDTRNGSGPIPGGTSESFNLPQAAQQGKGCPMLDLSSAAAYSLNLTAVPPGPLGYVTIWPTGEDQPVASTENSLDGRVKANAAIVPAGYQGAVSVFVSNTSDVLLDIDGYFATPNSSTLAFYPLTPCRVADTRQSNGFPPGLGPPSLSGGVPRDFPILMSTCGIPNTAQAYSFNFTAVPPGPLGYLTVWPAGQTQPVVSTLNDVTGTVVANAAIVPAGTGGDIDALASNNTDLVIDVNGYFAPQGQGGLSLYPSAPCRVLDTRNGNGQFVGELTVDVVDSVCGPSNLAQAYVFNATVVPPAPLGYLTLWPDGGQQPGVSTLNAVDGAVTSNMAIVPTTNGSIDAFASNLTQLVLDISAYFAP